jgi:hypothetical protein
MLQVYISLIAIQLMQSKYFILLIPNSSALKRALTASKEHSEGLRFFSLVLYAIIFYPMHT